MNHINESNKPLSNALILRHHQYVPIGGVIMFAGSVAPDGFLLCNGAEVLIDDYNRLNYIIGNAYGTPSINVKFKLPDLRFRFPLGKNNIQNLGDVGGEENHTLTANEMPSHNHGVSDPGHTHNVGNIPDGTQNIVAAPGGGISAADEIRYTETTNTNTTGISINTSGGGQAHNNMPPYIVMNYIIKY
jgi:microcystin-dependent protein